MGKLICILWSQKLFIHVLVRLGPLFIKLGQILSVRPDICSPEVSKLFITLRERVPPQYINVHALISHPSLITIEDIPFACGSIAQVYKGTILQNGNVREVVFKVIKPRIADQIIQDLTIISKIASIVDYIKPMWRMKHCVTELSTFIIKQTNFLSEQENMLLFATKGFNIPMVIPDLCSDNILCMEYITGSENISHKEKYTAFVKLCGKMLSSPCLLHLDLHPGNIIWVRQTNVVKAYLLDVGLCQSVEDSLHTLLLNTIFSILRKDHLTFAKLFLCKDVAPSLEWTNFVHSLFSVEPVTTQTVVTIFVNILRHCHKHNIAIDERMSSIVMALTIINGHYNELAEPNADFLRDILLEL